MIVKAKKKGKMNWSNGSRVILGKPPYYLSLNEQPLRGFRRNVNLITFYSLREPGSVRPQGLVTEARPPESLR